MKKIILIVILFLSACDPPSYKEERYPFFPQGFSEPVAFVAVEWNNRKLIGTGSAFLIDREKGLMLTAKHVSDVYKEYGSDVADSFINTHVYDHFILRVPPLRDASLVKLIDFDPKDLPDPYPISQKRVAVGDTLYVRGYHRHRNEFIKMNEEAGFPDNQVPIIEKYYKNFGRSLDLQEGEIVYHNIKVRVEALEAKIDLNQEGELFYKEKNDTNTYIQVKTERDHLFSFGGLSGGVVVNTDNEIVGAITAEQPGFEEIPWEGPFQLMKKKYETIYVTPIWDIQELLDYAKQVR